MGTHQKQTIKKAVNIDSYELKESREGSLVPSINGVHLHSSYNPEREAEAFIEKNAKTLEEKPHILLLGLGLGYHLKKMAKVLERNHGHDFKIFVIEPIDKLFNDAKRLGIIPSSKNIFYYTTSDITKIYNQKEVLEFLVNKPGIIIHQASFNFNRAFFEGFLSYRVDQDLKNTRDLPISIQTADYLTSFGETLDIKEAAEQTRQKPKISGLDQLLLAMQVFRKETEASRHQDNSGESPR